MAVKFSNNATTTLASSITSTDTSITVAGSFGALFPSAGGDNYFYATLINSSNDIEIVKVIGRTDDVMTVVRGQDGTAALNWIGGDKFELRVNAKALSDIGSGENISELNGVEIGLDDPQNAGFLDVTAQVIQTASLQVSGSATGPTPSAGDNSSNLATTAYVDRAIPLTNWSVAEVGGVLYFKHSGINKMKIDSSGNLTVTGNITAYGTV